VPPIRDLDRVGCAETGGFGVRPGPVTADDLQSGMSAQPVGEDVGRAVGNTSIGRGVSMSMITVP